MPTMDDLRVEAAHRQQRDRCRAAYARFDRLEAQQDRLDALSWHRRSEGRAGALVVAIRDAKAEIAALEAEREVEATFNLPPILDVGPPPRRPWDPPAWKL